MFGLAAVVVMLASCLFLFLFAILPLSKPANITISFLLLYFSNYPLFMYQESLMNVVVELQPVLFFHLGMLNFYGY